MKSKVIAKNFLYFMALCHIGIGLALPILVYSGATDTYIAYLNATETTALPSAVRFAEKSLIALFGPTIASWGMLFLLIIKHDLISTSRTAFLWMTVSCLGWAAYDSVISASAGYYLHVLLNTVVLGALIIPLFMLRARS